MGAILIESASQVKLSQVTVTHSYGKNALFVNVNSTVIKYSCATGLSISDSTISFTGNNTFMNNSGGGALAAFGSQQCFVCQCQLNSDQRQLCYRVEHK